MEDAAAFPERPWAPQFIRAPRRRRGLRALWVALIATVGISFAALLYFGAEIYQMAPPIPEAIETSNGQLVFDRATIHRGQDVWRSVGGQELGSVWGHGAYTAPDWTADWLHRERPHGRRGGGAAGVAGGAARELPPRARRRGGRGPPHAKRLGMDGAS